MSKFLETVKSEYNRMRARTFAGGYEGVTHAGIAVVRFDGEPSAFLARRSFDETDDEPVRETWEMPGGSLEDGEDAFEGAAREFREEIGFDLPDGQVINGWRAGEEENYQGFVYEALTFPATSDWKPTEEVQAIGWFTVEEMDAMAEDGTLRPEVAATDYRALLVRDDEEDDVDDVEDVEQTEMSEPEWDSLEFSPHPIPVHGVIAPEEAESGDARAFAEGAMTTRPLRIPFRSQKSDIGGHDGAVTVGSVDRVMRGTDGLIHWEGLLMPTAEAGELIELIEFFDNRYGVSVDGDRGSLDEDRSNETGVTWFDAVRAAGLTAVAIPAFSEAYVALGPHPMFPEEEPDAMVAGACSSALLAFKRGKGWVTHPKQTSRIHQYWMPGNPGGAKIRWGTPGDFTRAKALIGEKIAKNSPEKMRYLNQIIAEWHHDALGYWPGELGKPGNPPDTPENRRRAARHAEAGLSEIKDEPAFDLVLTSSAGVLSLPPATYFDRHEDTGALVIDEPDEHGLRRTYGYAGERGVCHIGYENECVEMPYDEDDLSDFHLGRTRTEDGYIATGLITYKTEHRDARTILSESAEQAHYDNVANAWAAVRLGKDERGIWFSGVVLPHVEEADIVLIEAAGQVSGEWKYGALRGLQCVNIPGFPVMRSSAVVDDEGNVLALAASAMGTNSTRGCQGTPSERIAALRDAYYEDEVRERMAALKSKMQGGQ